MQRVLNKKAKPDGATPSTPQTELPTHQSADEADGEAIAIIGMAGRFPGSRNLEEFWENLRQGVESVSFFSRDELLAEGVDPALLDNSQYVRAAAVLQEAEMFDAAFFGMTPREATITDPQHRLFLECAWEALEAAGYDSERYEGRIGVYAGTSMSAYLQHIDADPQLRHGTNFFQNTIGNDKDHLPTRVSYKLNLRGPSIDIQTACSTSLVAVHLACQSLFAGECEMALAGGVSVKSSQKRGYLYQEGGINSPDGHCRAFDAAAQGTILGNGLGIVVLKRLRQAEQDGDTIRAVILGSAVNNDGSLKVGYTAPGVEGQVQVITDALRLAGVDAATISYVEAHGTGTPLGDPIEVAALTESFRAQTQQNQYCALGSLKSNIGHLDTAAGVAGLIKTVLALEQRALPPSLHYQEPSPQIDFANSPFYVNHRLQQWEPRDTPRRAAVSSFGIGGTNAHVILEEAPAIEPTEKSGVPQLLALSAKTVPALDAATAHLAAYLKAHEQLDLANVSYTLQAGRRAFKHRRILVARDLRDAVTALERPDAGRVSTSGVGPEHSHAVFMYPGQGTQYTKMGLELYEAYPVFRQQVDIGAELLSPCLGFDLRQYLYPSDEGTEKGAQQIDQSFIAQPALFIIEYALTKLWMEMGMRPQALIGHSIGEYVAACVAGVVSLEEALMLVAARGLLMQGMTPGRMLSAHLSEAEIAPLLNEKLSLAAVNGPSLCTVSGSHEAIAELEQQLTARGSNWQSLHTSHAFHSSLMEPVVEPFVKLVKKVRLNAPQIPYISNLTGTWITAAEATDPDYWGAHLRHTVRFADGLQEVLKEPRLVMLEVGPGNGLCSLVRQHPYKLAGQETFASLRHPKDRRSDVTFFLNTVGVLWLAGTSLEWSKLATGKLRRIPLPTYPFERQSYYVEPPKRKTSAELVHPITQSNGNSQAHSEVASPAAPRLNEMRPHHHNSSLKQLIAQQLEIISDQLEILQARKALKRYP
jgi:acyl transferase domain-containing protein